MAADGDFAERTIDLYARLQPEASAVARDYVLARTPPELQPFMQRLVRASGTTVALFAADDEDEGMKFKVIS